MATRGKDTTLALYRAILRAHKLLPPEMKALGDSYVRAEFKLHKPVKDQAQLNAFFNGWEMYLGQLVTTATNQLEVATASEKAPADEDSVVFGKSLPSDLELTAEQQEQLEKLKDAATKQE